MLGKFPGIARDIFFTAAFDLGLRPFPKIVYGLVKARNNKLYLKNCRLAIFSVYVDTIVCMYNMCF